MILGATVILSFLIPFYANRISALDLNSAKNNGYFTSVEDDLLVTLAYEANGASIGLRAHFKDKKNFTMKAILPTPRFEYQMSLMILEYNPFNSGIHVVIAQDGINTDAFTIVQPRLNSYQSPLNHEHLIRSVSKFGTSEMIMTLDFYNWSEESNSYMVISVHRLASEATNCGFEIKEFSCVEKGLCMPFDDELCNYIPNCADPVLPNVDERCILGSPTIVMMSFFVYTFSSFVIFIVIVKLVTDRYRRRRLERLSHRPLPDVYERPIDAPPVYTVKPPSIYDDPPPYSET